MPSRPTVLLLGGTGRTGGRVLMQLLERGVPVRALVRSGSRLPDGAANHPHLEVIEAGPLELSPEAMQRDLRGCGAVISCLGHTLTLKGVFGPPFDVVTAAVSRFARTARTMRPATPVRFVLMSSVSVNRPARADTRRGAGERALLWVLRGAVPPARDNQCAADFLVREIGPDSTAVEWTIVRPDTLLEGGVCGYRLSEGLVHSLFEPGQTNRANVAHFMCELVTDDEAWRRWKGRMPVIVNEA